ncbi:MAG: hypothetical protein V4706_11885 [Pseudomonadota bacterium]
MSALLVSLLLCLGSSLAVAQSSAPVPEPRINRNPAFRDGLPPAPPLPPSPRVTLPPTTGPCDPRDSTTRPVQPPASMDDRSQVPGESRVPGTTLTQPAGAGPVDCK